MICGFFYVFIFHKVYFYFLTSRKLRPVTSSHLLFPFILQHFLCLFCQPSVPLPSHLRQEEDVKKQCLVQRIRFCVSAVNLCLFFILPMCLSKKSTLSILSNMSTLSIYGCNVLIISSAIYDKGLFSPYQSRNSSESAP